MRRLDNPLHFGGTALFQRYPDKKGSEQFGRMYYVPKGLEENLSSAVTYFEQNPKMMPSNELLSNEQLGDERFCARLRMLAMSTNPFIASAAWRVMARHEIMQAADRKKILGRDGTTGKAMAVYTLLTYATPRAETEAVADITDVVKSASTVQKLLSLAQGVVAHNRFLDTDRVIMTAIYRCLQEIQPASGVMRESLPLMKLTESYLAQREVEQP